jgi:cardiolipin synthase
MMPEEPFNVVSMPKEPAGTLLSPPNLISIARVLPIPLIYWSLKRSFDYLALGLLGFAVLTDTIDGYLARRFRWQSNWGLILDPLADKLLIGSLAVFLVMFRDFPVWAAGLILLRDAAILGVGMYLFFRPYRLIVPSNRIGKLTTAVTSGALLLYTLSWQPYGVWCLWAAVACVFGSGLFYALGFIRLIRRPAAPAPAVSPDGSPADAYRRSGTDA